MIIKGTVKYQDLSGGFWGIIGQQGEHWKPVKMPKKLQKEGLKVEIEAQKATNVFSVFMWGTAIQISDYKIL
jgi:hypothetical protein